MAVTHPPPPSPQAIRPAGREGAVYGGTFERRERVRAIFREEVKRWEGELGAVLKGTVRAIEEARGCGSRGRSTEKGENGTILS